MGFDAAMEALSTIPDLIRQPASNPAAAMLLLLIVFVLFAVAALVVLLLSQRPPQGDLSESEVDEAQPGVFEMKVEEPRRVTRIPITTVLGVTVLLLAFAWVTAGVSTARRVTCESCHRDNPHALATVPDPHPGVSCVACHEYGSRLALATINTVERLAHIAVGRFEDLGGISAMGYGRPAASTSCSRCHDEQIAIVTHNEVQAVRMSHAEPLEAGAECIDCHVLNGGVVSNHTVGMAPCLRCHDGERAPASCDHCHTGDTALAVRADHPAEAVLARRQILRPQCASCHTDQSTCDECHGVRLPHSDTFIIYAHARDGAIDIWERDGLTCAVCHDGVMQRACRECHEAFPAHGNAFRDQHGRGVSFTSPGCTCHDRVAYRVGRTFCDLCHDARPEGALP